MTRSNCSWLTCGPCVVLGSNGSPTLVFLTFASIFSTNWSCTFCSTNKRDPAQQHWPWLKNSAKCEPWTAWSMSASDRKSTRLNSSHSQISYAVFCLKKKKKRPSSLQPSTQHDPLGPP